MLRFAINKSALVFFIQILFSQVSLALVFPAMPDLNLTPGELCTNPTEFRYPEKISYCERNVTSETKQEIIQTYNAQLGYDIDAASRAEFKIDHLIPLCMGGSNGIKNLWPQHKSIYEITDSLEFDLCEKLRLAKITQQEAVQKILFAKLHLDQAKKIKFTFAE